MGQPRRRLTTLAAAFAGVALFALVASPPAQARSISLLSAAASVDVRSNGGLVVEERLTVLFHGRYTFGYRDMPLRKGESIRNGNSAS